MFAIAAATPGPTVITLVARVLATGRRHNLGFIIGLVAGDLVWLGCAVFGVASFAAAAHGLFTALKWLGVAYLVYLAWRLWQAPVAWPGAQEPADDRGWRGIAGGLAVAFANPKTMFFYLALLPSITGPVTAGMATYAILAVTVVVVYGIVLAGYVAAATRARRLLASPVRRRLVNRGASAMLAGSAVLVASRG